MLQSMGLQRVEHDLPSEKQQLWQKQLVCWEGLKTQVRDFPGGPGVKTLCFQLRGSVLDPWSEN